MRMNFSRTCIYKSYTQSMWENVGTIRDVHDAIGEPFGDTKENVNLRDEVSLKNLEHRTEIQLAIDRADVFKFSTLASPVYV